MFGICLGHQIIGLALGAPHVQAAFGHHGGNHPVRNLATGRVEITSQNHNYAVETASLPDGAVVTHLNLNDGDLRGNGAEDRAARSACSTTPRPAPARTTPRTCSASSPT